MIDVTEILYEKFTDFSTEKHVEKYTSDDIVINNSNEKYENNVNRNQ